MVVHDKLRHLIVVSGDLSCFDHIHPHLDKADGTFAITTIFPEGGKYKLWVDATPKGGSRCLAAFYIYVHGLKPNPITTTMCRRIIRKYHLSY